MAESYWFPVDAAHVLMFARAVGDHDPAFAVTEPAGVPPAPPTFVQASAHYDRFRSHPQPGVASFGSGATDGLAPAGGRGLHAEQHFEYHKPVRVGMVLHVTRCPGARWEKQGRRGGTLQFSETITEYRDAEGELVVTARTVAVATERVVSQEG